MSSSYMKKLFFLIALALVLFWIWGFFASDMAALRILMLLETYARTHAIVAFLLFYSFSALSVLLGPFTSVPLVPAALLLWGEVTTFALLMAGWFTGSMAAYGIGRGCGDAVVTLIISRERLDKWRLFLADRVSFPMALLFRLATPAETGYVFGIARYNIVRYMVIMLLVEIPLAGVVVWMGDALLGQDIPRFAALMGSAVLVFLIAGYGVKRFVRDKKI